MHARFTIHVLCLALAASVFAGERDVVVTPVPDRIVGPTPGAEQIGPDGGVMVWVPPGEFMMGSEDEDADDDEQPMHRVRITKGFWLGKCEVTNGQYAKFLGEYGKLKDGKGNELIEISNEYCGVEAGPNGFRAKTGRERHPVVEVSWYGAKAYCDHYGLTLPTEAQWEYAARGERGLRYPWGDEWDAKNCCNWENRGIGSPPPTVEVGSLPVGNSWCGACDMVGNVWEWCADWYDEGYYGNSPAADPSGVNSGRSRVLRGGSWYHNPDFCRATGRIGDCPEGRTINLGFRVCRTS